MRRLLGNDELVSSLMAQGTPIQINVELLADPATETGYQWSSSRGPNLEITSGTLTQGGVILEEDPPIRLVIPKIREEMGI
jgi:HlyD family secretion protein